MARYRWRYDKEGNAHPITEETAAISSGPYVMGDLQPYRSMATGQMVEGRRQHREMLKATGCIEIGNEKVSSRPMTPPPGLKQTLIEVVNSKL